MTVNPFVELHTQIFPVGFEPPIRPVRLLLVGLGQPVGLLEVGSAAEQSGLAQVRIMPILSSSIFDLSPCDYREISLAGQRLTSSAVKTPDQHPQPNTPDMSEPTSLSFLVETLGIPLVLELIRWKPHVVGLRIESGMYPQVQQAITAIRMLGETEIVLGGPTATSHAGDLLRDLDVDYVFTGEAETSIVRFLAAAVARNSRDALTDIPGMAYRWAGSTYVNRAAEAAAFDPEIAVDRTDLHLTVSEDVLRGCRLDWSLLRGYGGHGHDAMNGEPFDGLYFTAGRGCPGRCTFCSRLHGRRLRSKTAEQLLDEIHQADQLIREGRLQVNRYRYFAPVGDARFAQQLREQEVAWASIFDEDFFLDHRRSIRFFELWHDATDLNRHYRLSFQTNPCTLLRDGRPDVELFDWFDRLKPMIMLGGESFHPELLRRWRKRHTVGQLEMVLDALESTRQDYTVFQLLTDLHTTPDELVDAVWLLARATRRFPHMRVASSPMTITLYDTDVRRELASQSWRTECHVTHWTDYEHPQPDWMDPVTAELVDLADEQLQWAIEPGRQVESAVGAVRVICDRLAEMVRERPGRPWLRLLLERVKWMVEDVAGEG